MDLTGAMKRAEDIIKQADEKDIESARQRLHLHDQFAGQALLGLLITGVYTGSSRHQDLAKEAHDIADAMVTESEKRQAT